MAASTSTFLLAFSLAILFVGGATSDCYYKSVTYYVHVVSGADGIAIGTDEVLPGVNASVTGSLGSAGVFQLNITQEEDIQSKQVGFIRGFEIYVGLNASDPTTLMLNTVNYNDGVQKGTFQMHGEANFNTEITYDVSVVGGTGDFVGARGFSRVTNLMTPGSDSKFRHVLHICVLNSLSLSTL
eukprot:c24636_g1_i1 orf=220-771(+)